MYVPTVISVAAFGLSLVSFIRGEMNRRRQAPDEARRTAVHGLSEELLSLQAIIDHADVQRLSEADIGAALKQFEREWQRWEHQLPTEARHIRVGARQAMTTCFGAPATAGLDPRAAGLPADELDRHWWNIGSTWLEHAQRQLQRWLIDPRRRPLNVTQYDLWRRDED